MINLTMHGKNNLKLDLHKKIYVVQNKLYFSAVIVKVDNG